jgi:hypothetical protein
MTHILKQVKKNKQSMNRTNESTGPVALVEELQSLFDNAEENTEAIGTPPPSPRQAALARKKSNKTTGTVKIEEAPKRTPIVPPPPPTLPVIDLPTASKRKGKSSQAKEDKGKELADRVQTRSMTRHQLPQPSDSDESETDDHRKEMKKLQQAVNNMTHVVANLQIYTQNQFATMADENKTMFGLFQNYKDQVEKLQREASDRQLATQLHQKIVTVDDAARDGAGSDISSVSIHRTNEWVRASNEALRQTSLTIDNVRHHEQTNVLVPSRMGSQVSAPVHKADHNIGPPVKESSRIGSKVSIAAASAKANMVVPAVDMAACTHSERQSGKITQTTEAPSTSIRRDVKVKSYNGDGNVEQYLAQFRLTAELAGWPEAEWGIRLATVLEGKARAVLTIDCLPKRPSFARMSELLRTRFSSEALPELWRTTLEARKRGEKESLHELMHNILEMAMKAFPSADMGFRKILAGNYFVNALTDERQREYVRCEMPKDIDEAVKKALAFENARKTEEHRQGTISKKVRAIDVDEQSHQQELFFLKEKGRGKSAEKNKESSRPDTGNRVMAEPDDVNRKELQALKSSVTAIMDTQNKIFAQVEQIARKVDQKQNNRPNFNPRVPQAGRAQASVSTRPSAQQTCWNCGSSQHWKRECPEPRRENEQLGNWQGRSLPEQSSGPHQN